MSQEGPVRDIDIREPASYSRGNCVSGMHEESGKRGRPLLVAASGELAIDDRGCQMFCVWQPLSFLATGAGQTCLQKY